MKTKYRKLEEVYKKIPELECKGLCHEFCTIIPAGKIEVKRCRERMRGKNPFNPTKAMEALQKQEPIPPCGALKDYKCSIYTARPAICRLYGVAEGLECPFGCQPKKKLTKTEAHSIIREVEAL